MSNERQRNQIPGIPELGQARQGMTDTNRKLTEMLGEMKGGGLNEGDTIALQELAASAARLGFHEQMQLYRIDKPLIDAGLQFPIQPEDLRRADPLECDVFWATAEVNTFPGGEYAMPIVQTTRGIDQNGLLLFGAFDSIYMTSEAYRAKGGKQVVLLGPEDRIPQGSVQGAVHMDGEMLSELNGKLQEINRINLSERLNKAVDGAKEVVSYHIYPEKEASDKLVTAFGGDKEAAQKAVDFFYRRGHVALVLELEDGTSKVMTLNALGDNKAQGGVNLIQFTDGRYGIVNTVRMLVGAGRKYRPEISRGYGDVAVAKYTSAIKAKYGVDLTADQLGIELGLKPQDAISVQTYQMRQDWAYENVTPTFSVLTFDKDKVMSTAPGHIQQLLEEFEGLQPMKVTPAEVIKMIDSGDMVDSFSLSAFASELLLKGKVVLNPKYADSSIVLERRAMPQLGNEEVLTVPQGPAFEPGLTTVGQVHPNTGDARIWYQDRYSTNPAVLEPGPKYEKVPIVVVLGMLTNLSLSVVDSASIFKALLSQKVLIPNI